jgi:hypothetical protein
MPKYLIKTTLVYQYEVEANGYGHAIAEGSDIDNLDKYNWVMDIENIEAVLVEDVEKEEN